MDRTILNSHILIVDDLEDNIMLIEDILETEGFTNIHSKLNAKDALEYIQKNNIDLIILDITMPEMDGITACRYIRQELKLHDIKILLATAKDDLETLKIGLEDAGANDYVRKSFENGVELLSRIKNLLLLKQQIDITKQTEKALKSKNKELQELTNLLDKYIITSKTDTKGIITYASQAFSNISGYNQNELLNQPHNILRHPDMSKAVFSSMWKTIQQGKVWRGEIKNKKKDGGFYWVDAIITADYDKYHNIQGYSAIRLDITAQREAEYLASYDFLTSLPNRAKFEEIASRAIKIAKRNENILAVFFIDFDKFKNINDTLGHDVGDEMLKIVSKRMQKELRETDTVARIGGDEFVILLESITDIQDVYNIANKVLATVQKPMHIFKHIVHTSASIGISLYPNNNKTLAKLMKNADKAMYHAKNNGRNNYQFYTKKLKLKEKSV